jgi:hypothetical protein
MSRHGKIPGWVAIVLCALVWPLVIRAVEKEPPIRIGNYYPLSLSAAAFLYGDAAAFILDPGLGTQPGTAAPDDSFYRVSFRGVQYDWGRVGNGMIGRLTAKQPCKVTFKLRNYWPGLTSQYTLVADGANGEASVNGRPVNWKLRVSGATLTPGDGQFVVEVKPVQSVYLAAGFDELVPFGKIDGLLQTAEQNYSARRARASGPAGDFLGAIADNLNNSRMYSSDNKMISISVSRNWVRGENMNPYFCWDSFFSALMANLEDPVAAKQTVRAILSYQSEDGLVPNFAHWKSGPQTISDDRSQPPVGALCVWKMHMMRPDLDFLREVYPKLAKWHAWWMVARNGKKDGLLEWGSNARNMQGAKYETGWDDTPHFEGAKMVGNTMNVYAVDLNSMWAMDAHYLALMANALGLPDDAEKYRREEKEMIQRINDKLWNPQLGLYCSRFWDNDDGAPGAFLMRITPMNFYPLICGAANDEQAKRTLTVMSDPEKFWGEWILPTVPKTDPLYETQIYWRGTIWAPVNYLVFQGVKRYAPPQFQAEYAEKSVRLFMNNWLADGVCGENYRSTTGRQKGETGRSDAHYTWGALLCFIGLESAVDLIDSGRVLPNPGMNQDMELDNIPLNGRLCRIRVSGGKAGVLP